MRHSTILLLLALGLAGCDNTPYDIQPVPDAPWSGPAQRAVLETAAQDAGQRQRWDGGGWHHAAYESFYGSLGEPLRSSSEFNAWQKSGARLGLFSGYERIAPYQFYVVSLWPTVVIMVPHTYSVVSNLSPGESTNNAERMVPIKYVNNYAALTTVLPPATEVKWYSPGEHKQLTPLSIPRTGTATIQAGKTHLQLQLKDNHLIVTRN